MDDFEHPIVRRLRHRRDERDFPWDDLHQMSDHEFRHYLTNWARTRDEILAGLAGDPVAIANNRREVNRLRHMEENDE